MMKTSDKNRKRHSRRTRRYTFLSAPSHIQIIEDASYDSVPHDLDDICRSLQPFQINARNPQSRGNEKIDTYLRWLAFKIGFAHEYLLPEMDPSFLETPDHELFSTVCDHGGYINPPRRDERMLFVWNQPGSFIDMTRPEKGEISYDRIAVYFILGSEIPEFSVHVLYRDATTQVWDCPLFTFFIEGITDPKTGYGYIGRIEGGTPFPQSEADEEGFRKQSRNFFVYVLYCISVLMKLNDMKGVLYTHKISEGTFAFPTRLFHFRSIVQNCTEE